MAYLGAEVTIPLGSIGIMTDMQPLSLPPGALIEATNVVFNKGTVEKAPGSLAYNSSALDGAIAAAHDWWPTPSFQRMIALTEAGSLYRDTGDKTFTNGTATNTGLLYVTPRSMFIEGGNEVLGNNKKLFLLTDGKNQVQVLDGDATAFAAIENPATDWASGNYPRVGAVHRNRLWLFSGNRAYASNTGDHENFTSSILTQSIFPGEGGDIIGVFVFKGRMFVFKEGNFVYYLNESDPSSSNWYWQKLASNFGLSSPNGIVNALDDMLVGNSTGTVTSYKAADTLGEVESGDIFRGAAMERYLRSNFHPIGLPYMHALYDEELKQIYFTSRSTYRTTNDRLINVDVNAGNPRISFLDKGNPNCLFHRRNAHNIPVPYYGSTDGKVYEMNREDRTEAGSAFLGSFQTAHTDFRWADPGLVNKQKHFDFVSIEFVQEPQANLSIDYFIDGRYIETKSVVMVQTHDPLDTFALDSDRLVQYITPKDRIPLYGTGRTISFRCYNSTDNQSFQIASITVGFRPGSNDNPR